ncbi:MAG: hypothetical protein WDZ42_01690, partial [Candidatus Saccharimonadales bacterium]
MFSVHRNPYNPLVTPSTRQPWRNLAAFNPSPVVTDDKHYLIYRGMARESYYHGHRLEISTIGICDSPDGNEYDNHRELIVPEEPWEKFGIEDPRVTKIDNTYYIFYTAISEFPFGASGIKVAVALSDDLKTIKERHLVTPFNAKAMALFPDRVNGKLCAILTIHSDMPPARIAIAYFDKPEDIWDSKYWEEWHANFESHCVDLIYEEDDHAEVGAPPILTDDGWLLVYSHIQNYFSEDKIFSIKAVLLDKDDPTKFIARTRYPFMVPQENYERYGYIDNIIFPSGAAIEGDDLSIYYGGADTVCANAKINLERLLEEMVNPDHEHVKRYEGNPVMTPVREHSWESKYVLNPTAIDLGGKVHILYRAIDQHHTSTIGYASSKNGLSIDERLDKPIYVPRIRAEMKQSGPDGNSGCEDARIVELDNRLYITYTAYNGVDMPHVAISSISKDEFLNHQWDRWSKPQIISPKEVDDKDAALFPEKINDKYVILHRIDRHVCIDYVDTLDFSKEKLVRCIQVLGPRRGMWDSQKVGINGSPIKTDRGWLMLYHGINKDNAYCFGAILLDLKDPTITLGRSAQPIME